MSMDVRAMLLLLPKPTVQRVPRHRWRPYAESDGAACAALARSHCGDRVAALVGEQEWNTIRYRYRNGSFGRSSPKAIGFDGFIRTGGNFNDSISVNLGQRDPRMVLNPYCLAGALAIFTHNLRGIPYFTSQIQAQTWSRGDPSLSGRKTVSNSRYPIEET